MGAPKRSSQAAPNLRRQRLAGRDREAQPRRAVPGAAGRLRVPGQCAGGPPAHGRAGLLRAGRLREHRAVERRYAVEDRRLVLAQDCHHRVRRRAAGEDHRGRTDIERKGHAVAEAVGEEELGGGIDEIVLPDPEGRHAVVLGGGDQIAVQVHGALRRAGGAGGVEPERDVVAGGGRCVEFGRRSREQIREPVMSVSAGPCRRLRVAGGIAPCRRLRVVLRLASGDHDLLDVGLIRERGCEPVEQRFAHDDDARPRVAQQVRVVARSQQGINWDRHAAGLDCAPEHRGEVDAVEHAHQHPGLHPRAERTQRVARPVHPLGQLAVGVAARGIDEGGLLGSSLSRGWRR